jgi:CheY-like chemotaxis protein
VVGLDRGGDLPQRPSSPPIIFITAFDEPATRERALEAGAAGYLQKPFDEDSLLQAIGRAGFAPSGPVQPT